MTEALAGILHHFWIQTFRSAAFVMRTCHRPQAPVSFHGEQLLRCTALCGCAQLIALWLWTRRRGRGALQYLHLHCTLHLHRTSAPFFQGATSGYFERVSITTPVVSAWKPIKSRGF